MELSTRLVSLVCCAGGGGLALGLEQAGFAPQLLFDNRPEAVETLQLNRPRWDVREMDLLNFRPAGVQQYEIDLLAAGLPRLRSSATVMRTRDAGVEADLVRATIHLMHDMRPKALLLDNVPDLVTSHAYTSLRSSVETELAHLGYTHRWLVLNAANFGVPQNRKHGVLMAFKDASFDAFEVRCPLATGEFTVGSTLRESMGSRGWPGALEWAEQADILAPTLVGGSLDRGGADLGPVGSKRAWARIGVDGATVADLAPGQGFEWDPTLGRLGMVKLTVEQVAMLQGFPPDWKFAGRKTSNYRQAASAMPPPLARALGVAIAEQLFR